MINFEQMNKKVSEIKEAFLLKKRQRDFLKNKLNKLEKQRDDTIHNIDVRVKTIHFIEQVASKQRIFVKQRVQKLVTDCLRQVYDDSYSVQFDYGIKNNKTSVEINIIRKCNDGLMVKRGIDGIGGGVADTVSLPLKLIVLMNDDYDKVLITDEPGKHLDTTRIVKFAKFVQMLSHKLGIQIIMSSHHAIMNDYADSIHKVSLQDSVSLVERLK